MAGALFLTAVILASVVWLVVFRGIDGQSDRRDLRKVVSVCASAVLLLAVSSVAWITAISVIITH
jgi:hypothetical protein